MTPGNTLAGYYCSNIAVYVNMAAGCVDGGHPGPVAVVLAPGTSYALADCGLLVPPGLLGSMRPYRQGTVFPGGSTFTLLLPESLALVAVANAAGDFVTSITAYL